MSLFRDEVFAQRMQSLQGTISLAVPISWHVIGLSLVAIVVAAGIFLDLANYSRTEVAAGSIEPAGGVLQISAPRAGRVEQIAVKEGQMVHKGDQLAWIRVEEADRIGAGKQAGILLAIDRQQQGVQAEQASSRAAAAAEQQGFTAQIMGLHQEVVNVEAQVATEQRLVDMAQADLAQAGEIASRGFISRRDLAVREETLLLRQQQLAALRQTKVAKTSSIEQAERARSQAAAKASGTTAGFVASRAQIERDRVATRSEEGYSLVSPANGRVAALSIHDGDAVEVQAATMAIVPSRGTLVARLFIPDKAAGFVRVGQKVRLAIDAYPYDRFGTVEGAIVVIAAAPVIKTDKNGASGPVYMASVAIKRPFVSAYGKRQPLIPGMALTARIVIEDRSLIQWLFDPIFAAAR